MNALLSTLMPYTQYQLIRNPVPADYTIVAAAASTDILARPNAGFRLVLRGQGGYSEMSDPCDALPITAGDGLTFTPQSTVRATGGSPYEALIVYEDQVACDPETAWVIGGVRLKNIDTINNFGSDRTIVSLIINKEEHLNLDPNVPTSSSLPVGSDRLQFMVRYVVADNRWVRYDNEATASTPGVRYEAVPSGYWVDYPYGNKAKITSLQTKGSTGVPPGNDISVADADERLPIRPPVPTGFLSATQIYAYRMNSGELTATREQVRWRFTDASGVDISEALSNAEAFQWTCLGSVNRNDTDLLLDTAWDGVGQSQTFNLTKPFLLSQDLNPDHALLFSLQLVKDVQQIVTGQIKLEIIQQTSQLPSVINPQEGGDTDGIYLSQNNILIVPNSSLSGVANIIAGNQGRTVQFNLQPLAGAATDCPDQWVVLNTQGQATVQEDFGYVLLDTEIKRALVSTDGSGDAGAPYSGPWSGATPITIAGGGGAASVELTLSNPYVENQWEIRGTYPDTQLTDKGVRGLLRPPQVEIIVETGGTYYLQPTTYAVASAASQVITITSIDTGTPISFPAPEADFGLYAVGIGGLIQGTGGGIADGTYNVYVGYHYPSPNSVFTRIDHSHADIAPLLPSLIQHIQNTEIHLNIQQITAMSL